MLSSGELFFQPGVRELEVTVNVINDDIPEVEENFHVSLKNPKGGAEIGFRGQVTLFIPANDDAYGILGFAQVLILKFNIVNVCFAYAVIQMYAFPK